MGKILAFQLTEEALQRLKYIGGNLRLPVEEVPVRQYKRALGMIAGEKEEENPNPKEYDGEPPEGSLLVFCGLEEKKLDRALAAIRQNGIGVTYKAVLTPTNQKWNVLRLYAEMELEKRSYEKQAGITKGEQKSE